MEGSCYNETKDITLYVCTVSLQFSTRSIRFVLAKWVGQMKWSQWDRSDSFKASCAKQNDRLLSSNVHLAFAIFIKGNIMSNDTGMYKEHMLDLDLDLRPGQMSSRLHNCQSDSDAL